MMFIALTLILAELSPFQQMIVTIAVGTIPPIIITLLKQIFTILPKEGEVQAPTPVKNQKSTLRNMALLAEQRLLLAIGLLLLAISMLICVSFLGQQLKLEEEDTFTTSIVVAMGTALIAFWTWRKGTLVLLVAYSCCVSLGMTVYNLVEGREGSPLNLAMSALLYLFVVGVVVHYVGYPYRVSAWLSARGPRWGRWIAGASWLVVIGIPAVFIYSQGAAMAREYTSNPFAEDEPSVPKGEDMAPPKKLLADLNGGEWTPKDFDVLFRMGSELQLADHYRRGFLAQNPEAGLEEAAADNLKAELPEADGRLTQKEGREMGVRIGALAASIGGSPFSENGADPAEGETPSPPTYKSSLEEKETSETASPVPDRSGMNEASEEDKEEAAKKRREDTNAKTLKEEKEKNRLGVYDKPGKGFLRPVYLSIYPPLIGSSSPPLVKKWSELVLYRSAMIHPVNLKPVVPQNGDRQDAVGIEKSGRKAKSDEDVRWRLRLEKFTAWSRYKQQLTSWNRIEGATIRSRIAKGLSYSSSKRIELERLLDDRSVSEEGISNGLKLRSSGDINAEARLLEEAGSRLGNTFPPSITDTCRDQLLLPGNLEMACAYAAYINAHLDRLPEKSAELIRDFHRLPPRLQDLLGGEVLRKDPAVESDRYQDLVTKLANAKAGSPEDLDERLEEASLKDHPVMKTLSEANRELLLHEESLVFFRKVADYLKATSPYDFRILLETLTNPVGSLWREVLLEPGSTQDKKAASLSQEAVKMAALSPTQREYFLNEIGLRHLYSNPAAEKISRWKFFSTRFYVETPFLAGFWYFAGSLVVLALLIFLGGESKRLILSRERLLARLKMAIDDHELQQRARVDEPAESAPFVGRQEVRNWLLSVAQRGFGTVAVVGRRGVGKTRVLREMLAEATNSKATAGTPAEEAVQQSAIGVWIQVPAVHSEIDFVTAVHRRLANNVESWIANRLKTLPVQARELLDDLKAWEIWTAVAICMLFAYSVMSSSDGYLQYALIGPTAFVVVAIVLIVYSVIQIPPVNLYGWIFRRDNGGDTKDGIGAALLYREAMKYSALKSRRSAGEKRNSFFGPRWMMASFVLLCFFLVVASIELIIEEIAPDPPANNYLKAFANVCWYIGIIYVAWRFVVRMKLRHAAHTESAGSPDVSLSDVVAEYRAFAESVISKLKHLNSHDEQCQRIVICLDELDKIAEPEQMRLFLRKIKGLFEIKGVYYFLSLAEDARRRLALGGSLGKDEVDSSVDHIVAVKGMNSMESRRLLNAYLERTGGTDCALREPVETFIVIGSAGIPRDLLRMADRVITDRKVAAESLEPGENGSDVDPLQFLERVIESETELFLQDELLPLAVHFVSGGVRVCAGVAGATGSRSAKLFNLIEEQLQLPETLAQGDSVMLRALFRLFLLTVLCEQWDAKQKKFPWAEGDMFEDEAILFAYNIPTQAISFLIRGYRNVATMAGFPNVECVES